MTKNKTSIILNGWIQSRFDAHMTMACLAAIRKFTDQPYEIIVVDNEPKFEIRDEYDVLKIDKYVVNSKDRGCYASYNQGAKMSDGEFLVFIQNDVFVPNGWLKHLTWYLKDGCDVVFPDQAPRTREEVLHAQKADYLDEMVVQGSRDAGLMAITRKSFQKIGGWPEGAKGAILAEKFMYERMGNHGLSWIDTRKVQITHIMAGTNIRLLDEDPEAYSKQVEEEETLKA